jgi:hypothetical protein
VEMATTTTRFHRQQVRRAGDNNNNSNHSSGSFTPRPLTRSREPSPTLPLSEQGRAMLPPPLNRTNEATANNRSHVRYQEMPAEEDTDHSDI